MLARALYWDREEEIWDEMPICRVRTLAVCEERTTPVPRPLGTRGALPGGQSVAGRLWTG